MFRMSFGYLVAVSEQQKKTNHSHSHRLTYIQTKRAVVGVIAEF